MKVKVEPVKNEFGQISVPMSHFKVIENEMARDVQLYDLNSGDSLFDILFDVTKGSITPTTFASREFAESVDDLYYNDMYEYHGNLIKRFGINVTAQNIKTEVEDYNHSKSSTPSNMLSSSSKKTKNISEICNDAKNIGMTSTEYTITDEAISYLNSSGSANTVLVDVFERDSAGRINLVDVLEHDSPGVGVRIVNKVPKTHTIVLYKQQDNYLVLDPNNATYSHILTAFAENIVVCASKKCVIYKSDIDTGPSPEQSRDCVDVACKLAFNIETNLRFGIFLNLGVISGTNTQEIDINSLRDSCVVKEITNQQECYKNLPKGLSNYTSKLKQSSDIKTQKKITTYLKALRVGLLDYDETIERMDAYHINKKLDDRITAIYSTLSYCIPNEFYDSVNTLLLDINSSVLSILCDELEAIDQL